MNSLSESFSARDLAFMDSALRLAKRGLGCTSPNPMVGAIVVKAGQVLGQGWHRQAGQPHAEVEAIRDARDHGRKVQGATLYVTLEPCSTHGRTPPCTEAILQAGIARVVAAATDPNPKHAGRGFELLRGAGVQVLAGVRAAEATRLNAAFNHWIVHRTPLVTVKAAVSLDGKIATAAGESKWITGPQARAYGMHLRHGSDAILVGVNTILRDDPRLTVRQGERETGQRLQRIVLDSRARIPLTAQVLVQDRPGSTTIVTTSRAPARRVAQLSGRAQVLVAPTTPAGIDLEWLLGQLGATPVCSLLVEGGGEVNASFLLGGYAHRIAFFYAPRIIGGRGAPGAVGGSGAPALGAALRLTGLRWRRLGDDLLLTAQVERTQAAGSCS